MGFRKRWPTLRDGNLLIREVENSDSGRRYSDCFSIGSNNYVSMSTFLLLVTYVMLQEFTHKPTLYRLSLDPGDLGIHNISIATDDYAVTSIFDGDNVYIVPAILSRPLTAVDVDLLTDRDAAPSITRQPRNESSEDHATHLAQGASFHEREFSGLRSPNMWATSMRTPTYHPDLNCTGMADLFARPFLI